MIDEGRGEKRKGSPTGTERQLQTPGDGGWRVATQTHQHRGKLHR